MLDFTAHFDARPPEQRRDPTGTHSIRRAFYGDISRRLTKLKQSLRPVLLDFDQDKHPEVAGPRAQIEMLVRWLGTQVDAGLLKGDGKWVSRYVSLGYAKGAHDASGHMQRSTKVRADSVQAASARTAAELRRLTVDMAEQIVRQTGARLAAGDKRVNIHRTAVQQIDKYDGRAKGLVNIAIIAAHADASLDAFEDAGLTHVGITPEHRPVVFHDAKRRKQKTYKGQKLFGWATAGDHKVCDICNDLEADSPYTLAEARNLLPVHPNCRCALVPWRGRTGDANPHHKGSGPGGGQFTSTGGYGSKSYGSARRAGHQIAFHGSKAAGFEGFKLSNPHEEIMPDRAIGIHVAKDPELAGSFTTIRNPAMVPYGEKPQTHAGGVYMLEIPSDDKFHEIEQPQHPYVAPGTPKTPQNVQTDQVAIGNMVYKTAFQKEPQLFARFLKQRWNMKSDDEAATMANAIISGKPYSSEILRQGKPIIGLDDYIKADGVISVFGDHELRAKAVGIFRQEMMAKGYAGLKYINTSPMETERAVDPTSYVVFDPKDIKFRHKDAPSSWIAGALDTGDTEDHLLADDFKTIRAPNKIGNPYHDPRTGEFTHSSKGEGLVKLTKVKQRVYQGKPVELKTKYNNDDTGRIAASIAMSYAKDHLKLKNPYLLTQHKGYKAFDMVAGNHAVEIKGGLVSNKDAKWKSGKGGLWPAEKERRRKIMATGTLAEKRAIARMDAKLEENIVPRKLEQMKRMGAEMGRRLYPHTIGTIINPDTKTADVFHIPTFEKITRWKQIGKHYKGTFRYE